MSFVSIIRNKYKIESAYSIPKVPSELKFAQNAREKEYLNIINQMMAVMKQDPMTGLTHKEQFKSTEKPKGVYIMIDGDGLKKMNDTYGHAAGHAAILAISDGIKSVVRSKDNIQVTRAGGDEFIVYVPDVSIPTGISIAKRMLENIRKQKLSKHYQGDEDKEKLDNITLTASFGVGYTEADADKALYMAKGKGRNRVEFYKNPATKAA
jgi:diguanylate cyclase (GGDEF)-like protein